MIRALQVLKLLRACGTIRGGPKGDGRMEMAQASMCTYPIGTPSAQMRRTTLAPVPGCGFPKALPFLRSKCAVRTTMARQQSARWPPNALIISPVAPWSCGTWICSVRMSLRSIGPVILIIRRSIGVAIWPKRNPLPQGGGCPSMIFLRKSELVAQTAYHHSLRLALSLPEPFCTDHLNPRLTCDAHALAFCVDLPQQA